MAEGKRIFSFDPLPIPPVGSEIPPNLQKFHQDLINYLRRLQGFLERLSVGYEAVDVVTGGSVSWDEPNAQFELVLTRETIFVLDTKALSNLQLDFLFYDCTGARP